MIYFMWRNRHLFTVRWRLGWASWGVAGVYVLIVVAVVSGLAGG